MNSNAGIGLEHRLEDVLEMHCRHCVPKLAEHVLAGQGTDVARHVHAIPYTDSNRQV